ncbi:Nif3-like dinuclear metal center hexameric protein [Glaciecola sp. SC05]|uniref:Nif3-like dinuclear metal center hexameric protein n=1 Tax=Glaciecola sp. SC05 TaxID=1987355 RepID=UPI003528AE9B
MTRNQLLSILNSLLSPHLLKDYCPNGLQIEGKDDIQHIVTGVTASQALIEKAIELNADAIVVHHGFFWKNEDYAIVGMKKRRISRLLQHDISLFGYHLPLDVHPVLGNNAQLGQILGLTNIQPLEDIQPLGIVMTGELPQALSHTQLSAHIQSCLGRKTISVAANASIKRLAWCTGGGQGYIDQVALARSNAVQIDAFVSGEISEQTTHSARELNIDYFAAGHHATERYGVKSLGEHLQNEYGITVSFVDIDNPA